MKKDWEEKQLGEVLQKTETINPTQNPDKEFIYIDVSSVNNQNFSIENASSLKGKDAPSRARKLVKANDVIFATIRPTLRRICIITDEYNNQVCSTGYCVLRAKESINPAYIFYYLLTDTFNNEMEKLQKGASYPAVTDSEIREQIISFPKLLSDQQRIVALLDEAFAAIATAKENADKNLQNARELFESHLQSVFTLRGEGWVKKPLRNVCDVLNGFAFKSEDAVPESQTQLIRMGNLYGNRLSLDRRPVFYPDSFAVNYQRYLLKEGDLIMSLTGTTGKEDYGYAVRIPDCGHRLLMNQRIAKFDSIKQDIVNLDYLYYYLRSRNFRDILYPTANGTRQANLSSVTIMTLPVPICPIREQKRIVDALDEMADNSQRLESIYQQKLAALDELKKSLLHQAFTGGL
jgi:type I restriction enzyme S subunit